MTRLYGSVVQEKAISKWQFEALLHHAGQKEKKRKSNNNRR
jgi:hypothetical protein